MREWRTAMELAGLPGLPKTQSGVIRAAKRGAWASRKRAKGKGLEYHVSAIPEVARLELQWRATYPVVAGALSERSREAGALFHAWGNGGLTTIPFLLQLSRLAFQVAKLRAQLKGERHA